MRESRKVVQCECCKTYWEVEPGDVILLPWPRMVCPKCGARWRGTFESCPSCGNEDVNVSIVSKTGFPELISKKYGG